jgi:hypothetical protein
MQKPVVIRCPVVGLDAQALLEAESSESDAVIYRPVACIACGGFHLVNPKTGRLLSEETDC